MDGKWLATGGRDDDSVTVKIWKRRGNGAPNLWKTLTGHDDRVRSVKFSPDTQKLASADSEVILIWSMKSGEKLQMLCSKSCVPKFLCLAWSSDSAVLASGGEDKHVRIWDVAAGKKLKKFLAKEQVSFVAFDDTAKLLASGGGDNVITVWQLSDGDGEGATVKVKHTLDADCELVNSISISPNGKYLASANQDGTIVLWDMGMGREIAVYGGSNGTHGSYSKSSHCIIMWAPDGQSIISVDSSFVKRWKVDEQVCDCIYFIYVIYVIYVGGLICL